MVSSVWWECGGTKLAASVTREGERVAGSEREREREKQADMQRHRQLMTRGIAHLLIGLFIRVHHCRAKRE
jgi:hypothetical protein